MLGPGLEAAMGLMADAGGVIADAGAGAMDKGDDRMNSIWDDWAPFDRHLDPDSLLVQ